MGADKKAWDFFVAGGTLHPDAPSYVERPADDELFNRTVEGEYCYVLTPRQMGKSSLMVRTAHRLQEHGVHTAIVDLTGVGADVTAEQWYLGLITRLKSQLRLSSDLDAWWTSRASLSPVQRFTDFLRQVVLTEIEDPVVIFIDEIDTTLNLDFSDDFFAAIRFAYNTRASDPAYKRLTFVLLGVAAPADLIKNPGRTPFNIGQGIDLGEFSWEDADVLRQGLKAVSPDLGEALFGQIYRWTGGHPYLTQKLCMAVAERGDGRWTDDRLGELVERLFLSEEARKETNLQFVRDKILNHPQHRRLLALYRKVYTGKKVSEDERSPIQNQLKLSGLVKVENGYLSIRNEIYRRAFDLAWVKENTAINPAFVVASVAMLVALLAVSTTFYNRVACMLWPRERWCPQHGQISEETTVFALTSCGGDTLFAGAEDGIYRRGPDDAGWVLEYGTNRDVRGLAVSSDCTLIYAAAPDYGVLRRDDGIWREARREEHSPTDVTRPEAVVLSGNMILAGGESGLSYSVADEVHNWKRPSAFPDGRVVGLVRNDGQIYAVVWGSGVWHCDEGNLDRWKPITGAGQITRALQAASPLTNGTPKFVGLNDGFYRWNGTEWGTGPEYWEDTHIFTRTFCFVIDSDAVYAGQQNNGVLRSTDGGLTWERVNSGFGGPPSEVRTLLIHAGEDSRRWLYAGTSKGLWRYLLPGPLATPTLMLPRTPTPTQMPTDTPTPKPTPTPTCTPTRSPSPTPYVTYVYPVSHRTTPDYPIFLPSTPFTESWGFEGAGLGRWPEGMMLVFIQGDQMGGPDEQLIESPLTSTETFTVSLSLIAPASDGTYIGTWQVQDADGNPISEELNVSVDVYTPPTRTPPPFYPPPESIWIESIIGCNVTFGWTWPVVLAEDEWFAVRLGKEGEPPHSVAWTKEKTYIHTLKDGGKYSWKIVICRGDPAEGRCGEGEPLTSSETGVFEFGGCGGGGDVPP